MERQASVARPRGAVRPLWRALYRYLAFRLGSSEDVANAVRFLASPSAAYITGQVVHVNGGMYM
jgi:NAD(P)-dependent dehydrogenase (short-subunit alcohol dehydrogenase family)